MKKPRRRLRELAERLRTFADPRAAPAQARRLRVGLALGGGFARGVAHVGVLRVLQDHGVPIHCLAGTSAGAVVAAAYAGGAPLSLMERVAASTHLHDLAEWTLSLSGLASDRRLEHYLRRMTPVERFDQLHIPLVVVASDLLRGEPVYFTQGELSIALRASCAYPGLFRPVEWDGRPLVDGFLTEPVPVRAVRSLGADYVIAVYLGSLNPDRPPVHALDIINRSFSILLRQAEGTWRPLANRVIEPAVYHFDWDDFQRTPELIAAGTEAARRMLPAILDDLRQAGFAI